MIADATVDLSAASNPATTSAINLFSSNFNTGNAVNGSTIGGSGNQVLPPRFVKPAAGDFARRPSSPTIDSGLADPANGTLDLDGNPRTVSGRTDIGAYEMQPVAVAVTPPATRPRPAP